MNSAILFSTLLSQSVALSTAQLTKLDVFASNFAEACTPAFSTGKASEKVMLDFALMHHWHNSKPSVSTRNGVYRYSRESLQTTIFRFFDKRVTLPSATYSFEAGEGEPPIVSRVHKVTGQYPQSFILYCIDYSADGPYDIETPSDAIIGRYVVIHARKSPREPGRFVIDSLATPSRAAWLKASGVKSTQFVRVQK